MPKRKRTEPLTQGNKPVQQNTPSSTSALLSDSTSKPKSAKLRNNNYNTTHKLHNVCQLTPKDTLLLAAAKKQAAALPNAKKRKLAPNTPTKQSTTSSIWDASSHPPPICNPPLNLTPPPLVPLSIEVLRQRLSHTLRGHFKSLLPADLAPPIQAYERWLVNARLALTKKQKRLDWLIPYAQGVEEGLVKDLMRAGVAEKEARRISRELGKESRRCVEKIGEANKQVNMGFVILL